MRCSFWESSRYRDAFSYSRERGKEREREGRKGGTERGREGGWERGTARVKEKGREGERLM